MMGCDQHGVAEASSPKGETARVSLLGLLMLTLARAGAADTSSAERTKAKVFTEGRTNRFFRMYRRLARSHLQESTLSLHR